MFAQSRTSTQQHQAIKTWWHSTARSRLSQVMKLMSEEQEIAAQDLAGTRALVEKNYRDFAHAAYPVEAATIRHYLLDTFDNLRQSLIYLQQNDRFQGRVRQEIAKATMDALRFHLLEAGICD